MRRRRRKLTDASDPMQKAKGLIELALDESTELHERNSAAMKAVKIIDKYDLLVRPFDDNKTVQTALDVVDRLADPELVSGLKNLGAQLIAQARRR